MLDIGWSEMLVIAVVAIVVIGPKDLPRTLRIVGRWIGKARAMAREFQNSLDDIVRETELDEIKKQITEVSDFDIRGEIEQSFEDPASASAESGTSAATEEAGSGASQAEPEPRDQAPAVDGATAANAQDTADDAPKSESHG